MKAFLAKTKEATKAVAEKAKDKLQDYKEARAEKKGGPGGASSADGYIDPVLESLISHVRNPEVKRAFFGASNGLAEEREARILAGTYNTNGRKPPRDLDLSTWLNTSSVIWRSDPTLPWEEQGPEMIAIGFQEIIKLNATNVLSDAAGTTGVSDWALQWTELIEKTVNTPPPQIDDPANPFATGAPLTQAAPSGMPKYIQVVSKQMVGIYMAIWVRRNFLQHVRGVQIASVGSGALGVLGNKGAIACRLRVHDTPLVLVTSHLASGQTKCAERNADFAEICRRVVFSDLEASAVLSSKLPKNDPGAQAIRRSGNWGDMTQILDHDHVLWFGDLNYRCSQPDPELRALLRARDVDKALAGDELIREMEAGNAFASRDGWKEGPITFMPTYKYRRFCDIYVGDPQNPLLPDPSAEPGAAPPKEKGRAPAWTDRILWRSLKGRPGGLTQVGYGRSDEINWADHRPVWGGFSVQTRQYNRHGAEDLLLSAWREVDQREGAMLPKCTVEPNVVSLGPIHFAQRVFWTATVTNTSTVPACIKVEMPLLPDPSGLRDAWIEAAPPTWLQLSTHELMDILPGESRSLTLEILVGGGADGAASALMEAALATKAPVLDAILLFKISGAGDQFLSIQASYEPSLFGVSLAAQAQFPRPASGLASGPVAPADVVTLPSELQQMIETLRENGTAESVGKGFAELARHLGAALGKKAEAEAGPEPVRVDLEYPGLMAVRTALDKGGPIAARPVPDIAAALLWYLASLPEPLLPLKQAALLNVHTPPSPTDLCAAFAHDGGITWRAAAQVLALGGALLANLGLDSTAGRALCSALAQVLFPALPGFELGSEGVAEVPAWTAAEGEAAAAAATRSTEEEEGGEGGEAGAQPVHEPREMFRRRLYAVRCLLESAM